MNNHQNQINEEEEEDRTHYQTMDDGEDVPSDSGYAVVAANPALPLRGEGSDQLTLSFQGEVYVFDSVSAEKVQAVLLLLGGYEIPSGVPTMQGSSQIERNSGDPTIRRTYLPQRAASLNRFREKRKERCFDKKIRYSVRKEVALRMQRKKGQFTSSKVNPEESGSSGLNGVDDSQQVTICTHCGTSSKSTPMMRRGPSGPRTLCNACGLMWANKGTLRALPKPMENQNLPLIPTEQGDVNDNSEIRANTEAFAVVTTSNENRDDNEQNE